MLTSLASTLGVQKHTDKSTALGAWGFVSQHFLQHYAKNSVLGSGCYRYSKAVKTTSSSKIILDPLKGNSLSEFKMEMVEEYSSPTGRASEWLCLWVSVCSSVKGGKSLYNTITSPKWNKVCKVLNMALPSSRELNKCSFRTYFCFCSCVAAFVYFH